MRLHLRRAFIALSLLCVAGGCFLLASTLNTLVEVWASPPPSSAKPLVLETSFSPDELLTPLSLAPLNRYVAPASASSLRRAGPAVHETFRQDVARSLANPETLSPPVRGVPVFQEGRVRGLRVLSVRPDSLYARLGVRAGDIVLRINGVTQDSPEHALEAYLREFETSRIALDIERDGQALRLTSRSRG
jgi:hypothetical protein